VESPFSVWTQESFLILDSYNGGTLNIFIDVFWTRQIKLL